MLQNGALQIRPFKKKFYLLVLYWSGFLKGVNWHATDEQEKIDIKKIFGPKVRCLIALNLSRLPFETYLPIKLSDRPLKLIFLSLITQKKNLHIILDSLHEIEFDLIFDIYGPIKDENYWHYCLSKINTLPHNICVSYKGAIRPDLVQNTLSNYHAFLLPTKGENFGHAIYEALSVGRPVIISNFTPWLELQKVNAGWNINIDKFAVLNAINDLRNLTQLAFDSKCKAANEIAKNYFNECSDLTNYEQLFS